MIAHWEEHCKSYYKKRDEGTDASSSSPPPTSREQNAFLNQIPRVGDPCLVRDSSWKVSVPRLSLHTVGGVPPDGRWPNTAQTGVKWVRSSSVVVNIWMSRCGRKKSGAILLSQVSPHFYFLLPSFFISSLTFSYHLLPMLSTFFLSLSALPVLSFSYVPLFSYVFPNLLFIIPYLSLK